MGVADKVADPISVLAVSKINGLSYKLKPG